MKKLCPKCASSFSDESVFCNKCGAKLIEYEIKDEDVVYSSSDDIHGDAKKIPQIGELYHKNEDAKTPEEKKPRDLHKKPVKKNDKDSTQEFDISQEIESMNKPAEKNTVKKKICSECGAEIPYDSAVCPACKKRLEDGYVDNDSDKKSKSSVSLTIIITALIIAVIIVGIVLAFILTSGNRAPGVSGTHSRVQSSSSVSSQISSEGEYTEPEETYTEAAESESYATESSEEPIVQSSEEPVESSDEAAESSAADESSYDYDEESVEEPAESSLDEQSYESETTDEPSQEEPVDSSETTEESTPEESAETTTE